MRARTIAVFSVVGAWLVLRGHAPHAERLAEFQLERTSRFAFLESLAFADDDRYVAIVGCADGLSTVVAGRVSTRTRPTPIAQVPCPAAIRNDLIVAFDHDDEVKRWTLDAAPLAPLHPLAPSTREIVTAGGDPNDLAISPDGSTVLAGYADGVLRLWRLP